MCQEEKDFRANSVALIVHSRLTDIASYKHSLLAGAQIIKDLFPIILYHTTVQQSYKSHLKGSFIPSSGGKKLRICYAISVGLCH